MKYRAFHACLDALADNKADIGPSVSIKVPSIGTRHIGISNKKIEKNHRFIFFPVKIYGDTNANTLGSGGPKINLPPTAEGYTGSRHLNMLLLDRETKIIERYEPFDQHLYFDQINELLEPLLYKLMEQRKIYFLKYQTTLNSESVLNDKNCGMYCLKYVKKRITECTT